MARPTRMQVFWAKGRHWAVWFLFAPIIFACAQLHRYEVTWDMLLHWPAAFWAVSVAVVGWFAGLFVSLVVGWMLVGSLEHGRVIANGGPFKVGDLVQVITGPHAGRIGRVYAQGAYETLHVDLGPEAKEKHEDCFGGIKLIRVAETELSD